MRMHEKERWPGSVRSYRNQPPGALTQFTYDTKGELIQITDPLYLGNILEILPASHAGAGGPRVVVQADGSDPGLLASLYDTAARLRAAGLLVETIDGMHSAPTHRLTCRAGSPRFTLGRPDGSADFERLDDVVAALEHAH